ncbi:MAG: hypothetical protein HY391_03610 [Deltaproteobacteria bacterium]|nr:hypothetical protein [Deltaproteobacteria bacterium]
MQKQIIEKFVQSVADKIAGDWVIIGGSLLPLLGIDSRFTEDIDIAAGREATQSDLLKLMEIAVELGLPVESVNQAASFFLYRIPNWEKDLVLLYQGKAGRIFRPNATLYLLLKIERLTETDLLDCGSMIHYASLRGESIDLDRLLPKIRAEIARSPDFPKGYRLSRLLHLLSEKNTT